MPGGHYRRTLSGFIVHKIRHCFSIISVKGRIMYRRILNYLPEHMTLLTVDDSDTFIITIISIWRGLYISHLYHNTCAKESIIKRVR